MELQESKILLDKISVIDFKFEKVKEKDNFNVFSIIRKEFDEVNLHSRFICELLNPRGAHGLEYTFLKAFLRMIDLSDFSLDDVFVYREYCNIDILIRNKSQAIIVENKIYANDQNNQLSKYYHKMVSEKISDIKLVYLTLEGDAPSEESIAGIKEILVENHVMLKSISYRYEILTWLWECLKESTMIPSVRETIKQYENLIKKITNQTMIEEEKKEVFQLLSQGDNISPAFKIFENWDYVRKEVELRFWRELEVRLKEEKMNIIDVKKYSEEVIWKAIKKNTKHYYGIMCSLSKEDGDTICLYIERSWHGNEPLFYGLTAIRGSERLPICRESKFDKIVKGFKDEFDNERNDYWLETYYPKEWINFYTFDKDTSMLIKEEKRSAYISNLILEIKYFVEACGFDNINN